MTGTRFYWRFLDRERGREHRSPHAIRIWLMDGGISGLRGVGWFAACTVAAVLTAFPVTAAEAVDFQRDVLPIFSAHCAKCHNAERSQSGLRLDRRSSLLVGGDYGRATIDPGDPDNSFLIAVVSGSDPDLRMPPKGDLLSAKQVTVLRKWIEQGAVWPGQMEQPAEPAAVHWSLQPWSASDSDGGDSIDAWVEHRLAEQGLSFSSSADAATLLRRVTLVLTGLPPTPNEVADFLNDRDGLELAYRRAVDRLLDSPRYGERWAQHWLDVIRWAETVGFETNVERRDAWHYRDWVIESLNEDKPYNQFLFEQLAGDTVEQDRALGFLVAGPANLPPQVGRDEEAMRQARQDELDEVIRTVSQSVLGLTVGCARCHNHKFDPITQRDYYAMQAIFAGLSYGYRRLRGSENDRWAAMVPATEEKLGRLSDELETLRKSHGLLPPLNLVQDESFEPVIAEAVRMEIQATENGAAASLYELQTLTQPTGDAPARNVALAKLGAVASASSFALANQTRHYDNLIDGSNDRRQAFPWVAQSAGPAWVQVDFPTPARISRVIWDRGSSVPADYVIKLLDAGTDQWVEVIDTATRMPRLTDTRKPESVHLQGVSPSATQALMRKIAETRAAQTELARLKAGPQVYAATFTDRPDSTWVLHRGDPMQRRDAVTPAIPVSLGNVGLSDDASDQQRRLAFAAHVTDPAHPLTPRVMVNRVWHHHFGAGLVDTPSDFGVMGSRPSHPGLLDWLAADFVAGGWSLKRLHRKIVLSRTFRQSSRPREVALMRDADSRLLWRYPPRRLEAESIRDSILQVSGKLNLKMGGVGFNLFKQRGGLSGYTPIERFDAAGWRRMIYAHKIRMQQVDIFGAFDCPDAGQMKPKRTRSITPTQSLSLFNSPFTMRHAHYFAERVAEEAGEDVAAQVDHAFRIAVARRPTDLQRDKMVALVQAEGLIQMCRVLFNTSEFLYIQ